MCQTISWSRSCDSLVIPAISLGSWTLLKRSQAQINLSLCSYTQTCVSIDTYTSYSPKFIQKENINSLGQNFSSLAKLPVGAAGYAKRKRIFCIQRKLSKGPVQAGGVRLSAHLYSQMNHLGRAAHLSMADSLHLLVESKHDWSNAAWMHQVFCVCITHFSAEGIPRETLIIVGSVIGKC